MTLQPNTGIRVPFTQPKTGHAKVRVVSTHKTIVTSPQLTNYAREHEFMTSVPAGTEWVLEVRNAEPFEVEVLYQVTEMKLVDLR
jgi:hypothetical protein